MLPYFRELDYQADLPAPNEQEIEEQARQAFFFYQVNGWCDMRISQPYAHWLVECKRNIADPNETPIVLRPISNNCVMDYWPESYFWDKNYYWRPAVFGCAPNN